MATVGASAFHPVQPGIPPDGSHDLAYRERRPPLALERDLVCTWEITGAVAGSPFTYRIAPDGCVDLVLDRTDGSAWLFGARAARSSVELGGTVSLLGLRIRPGSVGRVLGVPGGELGGTSFALDEVLGSTVAGSWLERACDPSSSDDAFVAAISALAGRRGSGAAARDRLGVAVADAVIAGGGRLRSDALARDLGVSTRQLQRACVAATGLAPKALGRVVRFQHALRSLIQPGRTTPLAALAPTLGFYDQAHLGTEIHDLLGTTPGALRRAHGVSDFSKTPRAELA